MLVEEEGGSPSLGRWWLGERREERIQMWGCVVSAGASPTPRSAASNDSPAVHATKVFTANVILVVPVERNMMQHDPANPRGLWQTQTNPTYGDHAYRDVKAGHVIFHQPPSFFESKTHAQIIVNVGRNHERVLRQPMFRAHALQDRRSEGVDDVGQL